MQNNTYTAPDNQAPDFIDYQQAEAALFEALNGPGGYARILAADYARQFGADIGDPDIVEDLAGALFSKAAAVLQEHGRRRVFSDKHLFSLCQKWAAHWAGQFAQRDRDRIEADAKGRADRLAYIHAKYGGPEGTAKGRVKIVADQKAEADERADKAQALRRAGLKVAEIAERLVCSIRTVYRLLRRTVAAVVQTVKATLTRRKGCSDTDPLKASDTVPEKALTACHVPEPPPPAARDVDKMDVIGELLEHWRATDG